MLERTHLVIFVLVLPALVACVTFRVPTRHSYAHPFKDPFRDRCIEYSFVYLLAQEGNGSRTVNTSLYRLPQNLKPTKYDLTVVPFLVEGNFTFYGKVIISITAVQDASEIVLNSKSLTVKSLSLTNSSKATIDCTYFLDEVYERLTIKYVKPSLVTGKTYELTIEYTGLLQDDLLGFYRSSYKIGSQIKWLAVTQFEPTHARKAFPCFDEPAFRAVFIVHVGRFEYQNSVSNMRLKSTSEKLPQFEDRVIDTYEESPHMPTYLVAFCVSEMVSVSSSDGRFRVSMREDAVDQVKQTIEIGESILKIISDFISVPYTLPKMDVIAVPDFEAGAMENWGMTTYRENYVLYEEGVSNALDKLSAITIVAHEFGHQWFGGLVTPQWWSYTWLNEAFATYIQYYAPSVIDPEWDMMSLFIINNVQTALYSDGVVGKPMTADVYTPAEIDSRFNYVSYQKGGSVLRMVEHFLSSAVFQTGLNYYLTNSSADGIGTPERLFSALDAAAKEKNVLPSEITVANVLNTWTTQGGFPLLTINRTEHTLVLSQKIFTTATTADAATNTFWYIPLTYTTQSVADFQDTSAKDWLLPGFSKTITTSDNGWVIFNIQQTGFYRVNYDANNWDLLAQQLLKDFNKIHVNNRAQIQDDAFCVAEAGLLDYDVAFNISLYLSQEREFVPWASAMRNLRIILRHLEGTNTGHSLEEYVVNLVRPYYQYLMGIKGSYEAPQNALSRIAFVQWACDLGIAECETYAKNTFNAWVNNGVAIGENVKAGVLCTGLKLEGDKEWDAVWNLYLQSNNYAERLTILKALACTQSEHSIDKYLNALIAAQSEIRIQDQMVVLLAIVSRQTGIPPMIRFIVNNYNVFIQKLGLTTLVSVLANMGGYMVRDEHIQQVTAIVNNETLPADLRTYFNLPLQVSAINKKWIADHEDHIQRWLNQTRTSSGTHLVPANINTLIFFTISFVAYVL